MHLDRQSSSDLVVLTASDVDAVLAKLDLELLLKSQQDVFTAFSASHSKNEDEGPSDIQIPHRSTLVTESQRTLVMPSRAGELVGCKFVGVPNEGSGGLPGSTVIVDHETGRVKGLVNARKLTALRNACGLSYLLQRGDRALIGVRVLMFIGSALSLRALPPKRRLSHLVIFGSGAQAHAHALVFLRLFPDLKACTLIVRQITSRSEALLSDLQSTFPKVDINLGDSSGKDKGFNLSQTIHNASVILTLVPTTTPLFNSVDVTSGTHLVLVGSYKPEMRDVDDNLIKRAGIVVVDSKEACTQEAGELISAGLGPESDKLIELGELFGKDGEDARSRVMESGDVTIFKSVSLLFRPLVTRASEVIHTDGIRRSVTVTGVRVYNQLRDGFRS